METILNSLKCSITGKYFKEPVIVDGTTIEKQFLNDNKEYKEDTFKKLLIQEFIKEGKIKKLEYYDCKDILDNTKILDSFNQDDIKDFFNISPNDIRLLIEDNDIGHKIINLLEKYNLINYVNEIGIQPIHYFCRYGNPKLFYRILDIYVEKDYDFNYKYCDAILKSIYYIIQYGTCSPIHFICAKRNSKLIDYILDIYINKGYDLECETQSKWKPIHYISYYGEPENINRILDIYHEKGYNLNCKTIYGGETYKDLIKDNKNVKGEKTRFY